LETNRKTVFFLRSISRCYKQDSWRNELVVRQSPAGKKVSTEVEDIVGIRHHATTGEDMANSEDIMCVVVTVIFGMCNSVKLSLLFAVKICINVQ
jgi:hypothetical protein